MKKLITFTLLFIFAIGLLSGCKGASTAAGSGKILFTLADANDKFRGILGSAAKDYAVSVNVELTLSDAANSMETQLEDIRSAKEEGYSAIICNLVNADTAQQMIAAANGLPIVFINVSPEESILSPNQYVYVGSDENVSGKLQADFLADYLKDQGKTSISAVLFEGEPTHPAALKRTEVVKQSLKENNIDVNYVFEDSAYWSRDKAKEMFLFFLRTNTAYDAIICNNDEMALGVIAALEEANIDPSNVPIVGIDGTPDACKAIVEGYMSFSVLQSANGQGKAAVEAAVKLSKNQKITDIEYATDNGLYIWIPFEAITSDNVSDYL